jgi:hypothetical protein
LYGSSRLGIYTPNIDVQVPATLDKVALNDLDSGMAIGFVRGKKIFELRIA